MVNFARFRPEETAPVTDPTTGVGDVWLFPEGFGHDGAPYVLRVEDPPNTTRAKHLHRGDVVYFYVKGEHRIEGEQLYRAGDVRWVRAGQAYGPETTGPEGAAWWVVSFRDPVPVDVPDVAAAPVLPRFAAPYDWSAIDEAVALTGGAVVEGLVEPALRLAFNAQIDAWIAAHPEVGVPRSGSELYDAFLGHRTRRLHGLAAKASAAADLITHPLILSWAQRMLAPVGHQVLLNAGELIDIGPDEPAQLLHRDNDSWPALPRSQHSPLVNAIVAMTDFTTETGATNVAPGSHLWVSGRYPEPQEIALATMEAGDVLLFRGDVIHGGGANVTVDRTRRGVSLSYVTGWLRPVEASLLNVPAEVAATLSAQMQGLLGYDAHDGTAVGGGFLGLFEGGSPRDALVSLAENQIADLSTTR
jgi:hypothetical protein